MRVAIYWEQDSWGGVDTHLLALLSSWPTPGDAFVLFHNAGNQGFERIRSELEKLQNVRCVGVPSCSYNELSRQLRASRTFSSLRYALYFFQPIAFLLMARRLSGFFEREGGFDLMLANNGGYPAAWGCLSALLAARSAGIESRVLLVHHAATKPALFMGWFEHIVDRMVNRTASAVVCVSYATRETLLDHRMLSDETLRLRVIHNGISPVSDMGSGGGEKFDLPQAVGVKDELLIGMVGRVEPYKGQEDLIFALARLHDESRRQFKVVVLGAGEEAELSRLGRLAQRFGIGDRVHFLGYVPGPSTALIAQLDLLVVATRSFEGFGLTLAEAMHVGTPVLATRVGAIPEFVDEENGVLVNPGSPREMAMALQDFLTQRDTWRRRAEHARQRIQDDGKRMAEEFHQLFIECIAERASQN